MKSLLISAILIFGLVHAPNVKASAKWTKMNVPSAATVTKTNIRKMLKRDMGRNISSLLKHKYLLRIELKGGTGSSHVSETVFLIKNPPVFGVMNSKSDLKNRSAVIISPYKNCKWDLDDDIHKCKSPGVANIGPINITNIFTNKHILLISKAKRAGRTKTVIWLAYDVPSVNIYYLFYKFMGHGNLGVDAINYQFFKLTKFIETPLPRDPGESSTAGKTVHYGNPRDYVRAPNRKGASDAPAPLKKSNEIRSSVPTKSVPPVQPVITRIKPQFTVPAGFSAIKFKNAKTPKSILFKKDYLFRQKLLSVPNRHWIRIQVSGLDSTIPDGAIKIKLPAVPKNVLIYAWTDKPSKFLSSVADSVSCKTQGLNGCPHKINGLRWYDLSGIIKTDTIEVRSFPNIPKKGTFIIWASFDTPVTGAAYHAPGFKGKILAYNWDNTATSKSAKRIKRINSRIITVTPYKLRRMLKSSGVIPEDSGLMGYKYIMQIMVIPDNSAKQILKLNFRTRPAMILGKSVKFRGAPPKEYFRVQIGNDISCRSTAKGLKCPYYLHDLGWRDLSVISRNSKNIRALITQGNSQNVSVVSFWMAFLRKPANFSAFTETVGGGKNNSRILVKTYKVRAARRVYSDPYAD